MFCVRNVCGHASGAVGGEDRRGGGGGSRFHSVIIKVKIKNPVTSSVILFRCFSGKNPSVIFYNDDRSLFLLR